MNTPEANLRVSWKCPATLKNVEQVCAATAMIMEKLALHKKDRFAVELLLREALNNAVIHGCAQRQQLFFSCLLLISEQDLSIEVADDGPGFNWRSKLDGPPGQEAESGRGMSIYALYAQSTKFNDNGNCITLTRKLMQGEIDG